jgi:cytidylate kinase
MVITIDGPAGAGKSSVARELARQLGFRFLDTGAMYRAVACQALDRGIDWDDSAALGELAAGLHLEFQEGKILLDGKDVSQAIREPEVTDNIHHVADNLLVREALVLLQRQLAQVGNVVTEGRDQGTVAFPAAEYKIFLTASPQERARRRSAQLKGQGIEVDDAVVLEQLLARDERDAARPVGGMAAADDAVLVNTDGMDQQKVVEQLVQLVRGKTGQADNN